MSAAWTTPGAVCTRSSVSWAPCHDPAAPRHARAGAARAAHPRVPGLTRCFCQSCGRVMAVMGEEPPLSLEGRAGTHVPPGLVHAGARAARLGKTCGRGALLGGSGGAPRALWFPSPDPWCGPWRLSCSPRPFSPRATSATQRREVEGQACAVLMVLGLHGMPSFPRQGTGAPRGQRRPWASARRHGAGARATPHRAHRRADGWPAPGPALEAVAAWSRWRKRRRRRAFTPTSLRPTRDMERMSS